MEAGATGKAQLLCALAILVALGALLAAGAGGEATAPPPAAAETGSAPSGAAPDSPGLAQLSRQLEPRVAQRVEALRGLEFDRVPKPEVVDSEYLNRLGARENRRAGARREAGATEAELRILGLLEPEEQLESIYGSTGDLAAAAYDPRKDRLYVVSDAVSANRALVEFVLAHELTHALEDQRFGLRDGARLDDDAYLAQLALTEGTATAMMIRYATEFIGTTDLLGATATIGAGDPGVPGFYVEQITWTYFGGARFIAALRRLGGAWKLVDYALSERPPATTEQVLHPQKYVRDEQAVAVEIVDGALRRQGWRRADAGVVGELTTSQMLELAVDAAQAERAAAGWGGDRYELWRREAAPAGCEHPCREDLVLVVDWVADTQPNAGQLFVAVEKYLDGLSGEFVGGGVWRLDGGFAAVQTAFQEVALVFAPDAETASAVAVEQIASSD